MPVMQVYLVGGAVRDDLLGLPASERDWVVVGATPEELERVGFRSVGREFPVFLHPETHEEYALARLERKTAPGYRGFETRFSPDVTLEQDLQRRDLTINAMARSADGALIDPYGGQRDLEQRLLRHVSAAFVEDPVRVLRVARFAARLATLGFKLAPETRALLRAMVDSGEINALVPERVWREMQRALGETTPEVFFDLLQECGALAVLLPELQWGETERVALRRAVRIGGEPAVRFAALLATTPAENITALCERLRVPNEFRELALLGARLQERLARATTLDAPRMLELLEAADAFRRPDRFAQLLRVAQARSGLDDAGREAVTAALFTATSVTLPREQTAQLRGLAIAAAYRAARIERLRTLLE
ncbi:MAG TPA: multifunctional CCA tRNA nucleotidyl transferase/2'3'-cyclic phosphodiesterase/2'nucleotidase/phosphatase [Steroidobacteraceae bacterium]|jgi:tRNA nucleotidyltransferase (CCA-adding enzyme)